MRISELLISIASWLESPENEAFLLAEYDENCLNATADVCLQAANILKQGALEIDKIEPAEASKLTPEALDQLNEFVVALDNSNDEELKRTASLIDELLVTIATPPNWYSTYKKAESDRLDELKKRYEDIKKQLDEGIGVKESEKAIDKSPFFKEFRILEHELSTRYCPDHPGQQINRADSGSAYQCSLDNKIYDFGAGYTTEKGEKVPGGSVAAEFDTHENPHNIFDDRQSRLAINRQN